MAGWSPNIACSYGLFCCSETLEPLVPSLCFDTPTLRQRRETGGKDFQSQLCAWPGDSCTMLESDNVSDLIPQHAVAPAGSRYRFIVTDANDCHSETQVNTYAATQKPPCLHSRTYRFGIYQITDESGRLQYIPFPTCNETGRPLELYYGVEKGNSPPPAFTYIGSLTTSRRDQLHYTLDR